MPDGTDPTALMKSLYAAISALQAARMAMMLAYPRERDYAVEQDFLMARSMHTSYENWVTGIINSFENEVAAIQQQLQDKH